MILIANCMQARLSSNGKVRCLRPSPWLKDGPGSTRASELLALNQRREQERPEARNRHTAQCDATWACRHELAADELRKWAENFPAPVTPKF
jgi:hypothetical protein